MSRDTRMRNDNLALCLWAHDVRGGISRKPLEIETWVQSATNRKWTIASPMVTWPMTSRDADRSRSWPQYVWCKLSRKWLEIANWWQWGAYRKWGPGNRIVTWPMTSRDPERSRSWPQYIWCPLSRKRWRWRLGDNGVLIRNWPLGIELPRDRWRHVTPKGQGRDLDMFGAHYLGNGGDGDLMTMERL